MKKFRDMTDSEKLEIINAMINGEPLEIYQLDRGGYRWNEATAITESIWITMCYRIPKRPMSIDWSVLKDEFICAARNQYEQATAFTDEPRQQAGVWMHNGIAAGIEHLKSYDPGTVEWGESLIWRPEYVERT